jgi:hypothetical protein
MAVTEAMRSTLTNGFTITTSPMRPAQFTKQEVGIMELVVVLCPSAATASQDKPATFHQSTTLTALTNTATFTERKL